MNTNAGITIYNRWYDRSARTDHWMRTQIKGVSWYGGQAVTVGDNGLLTADKYAVRIPLQSAPADKQYAKPEDYAVASKAALTGLWTLQQGDIIVRGLIAAETPPTATDRTERFIITGANDNCRGGLPHWRINGK